MIEGFGEELPEPEMARGHHGGPPFNQEVIAASVRAARGRGLAPFEHARDPVDPLRQMLYDRYGDSSARSSRSCIKAERNSATKTLLDDDRQGAVPPRWRTTFECRQLTRPTSPCTAGRVKAAFHARSRSGSFAN